VRVVKILFLHKQVLFPRDTGGKIRVLNLMKHLPKWHDVTYVCNLRPGEEKLLPQMDALGLRTIAVPGEPPKRGSLGFFATAAANVLSDRPFSINRNYDPAVRRKVAQLLRDEKFDLLICDTVQMARHTLGLPARATVLFQHNVEAQILRRHAEVSGIGPKAWFMRAEWRKMTAFEAEAGRRFDHVIAVSELDRELFERDYGWKHVSAVDTAVDADYFAPQPGAERSGRVAFVGSMDWMPNQDGVTWFVSKVWPKVMAAHPRATFEIVGRNPPAAIRALATAPGVIVAGGVPDVRPHLAAAAVVVVPLLVGGGTRLKIYEAMATARPVVSTRIGAEGLPLVPGEHYLAADEPDAFADAVIQLLGDADRRRALGTAADRFVRERYGSEPVARQFDAICREVVERKHPTSKTP
jgi:glycosyltransferase involved in cell wall biosynthesis